MIEDICNLKLPKEFRCRIEVYAQEEVDEHNKTIVITLDHEDSRRKKNMVTKDFCLYSTTTLQHVVDSMVKEFA